MNYEEALSVKQKIAQEYVLSTPKTARIFGASAMGGDGGTIVLSAPKATRVKRQVLGTGVAKNENGEHLIKLFVTDANKIPADNIACRFGIRQSDILVKQSALPRLYLTKTKQRPPFPGISIGHYKGLTGTLGCIVKDAAGNRYILSNNHVLANLNDCEKGDKILQPGRLDKGNADEDAIAHLYDYIPIKFDKVNEMDAAIAKLEIDLPATEIPFCEPFHSAGAPEVNARVKKYGRTSGGTEGVILSTGVSIPIVFNNKEVSFTNLFEVQGVNSQGDIDVFSSEGDSGALIVDIDRKKAVGLLFAGIDGDSTFACAIEPILNALGVDLVCKRL